MPFCSYRAYQFLIPYHFVQTILPATILSGHPMMLIAYSPYFSKTYKCSHISIPFRFFASPTLTMMHLRLRIMLNVLDIPVACSRSMYDIVVGILQMISDVLLDILQ